MVKRYLSGLFLAFIFLLTFIVELLMLTTWMGKPSLDASPAIWLVTGILNAWTGSILIGRYGLGADDTGNKMTLSPAKTWGIILTLIVGVGYTAGLLHHIFQDIPELSTASDIIPGKKEFVRRLLHGETVYLPVHFDTYDLQPTFLPFRWLPFTIAEVFKFDYRWIPFSGFVLGVCVWIFSRDIKNKNVPLLETILKVLFPFWALGQFIVDEKFNFGLAVELLILGYHLILARFMFHKNPWVVGLSVVLCLLSRYSIILWLAVPATWLILEKRYAFLGKIILATVAGIFLFYWLPFCRHDLGKHFITASHYYVEACRGCWHVDSWQPADAIPSFLGKGQGFQYWSYAHGPADLEDRYQLNMKLGLWTCAASILISCIILFRYMRKENDPVVIKGLILGSLKVYMIFFIGFIMCPFSYLFIVPFFLSLPMLYSIPFKSVFYNQLRRPYHY